ncbi:MAG: hypothetical protein ACRC42_02540, partial [Mycoplasma sp.]
MTDPENTNKIQKGVFKKFVIELTQKEENQVHQAKTFLKLEDSEDELKLSMAEIPIDTHVSKKVDIYIGISCNSKVNEDKQYDLRFDFFGGDYSFISRVEVPTITVQVNNITKIFWAAAYNTIPPNNYGLYRFDSLLNFDKVTFSFTQQNTINGSVKIEKFTLNEFVEPRTEHTEIYSGKIKVSSFEEGPEQDFTFEMEIDNQCYTFFDDDNLVNIIVKRTEIPHFNPETIKDIKKSIVVFNETKPNEVGFQISLPPRVIISCVLQRTHEEFMKDEDLRDMSKDIFTKDYTVFQKIIDPQLSSEKINVIFYDVSRLGGYKVKCLIDNTVSDQKSDEFSSFSFTMGESVDTDNNININVMPSHIPLTPGECAIWYFNENTTEDFNNEAVHYCNDYLDNKHPNKILFKENGCMSCEERNFEGIWENYRSICLVGLTNCLSNYQYNATNDFDEMINTIDTTEKIEEKLGLKGYKVSKVVKETDTIDLDISQISFQINLKTSQYIELNV